VFLAVLAERCFGFRLGRRQWAGVTITAAGLAIIGLTTTAEGPQRSSLAALIAVESGILAAGIGLVRISTRSGIAQRREGLLLATPAAVLFGVSDVAIKFLTYPNGPLLGLLSPWTLTAVISFVISFYASARSLQIGLAVEVIAITAVAANLARSSAEFSCSASRSAPTRLGSPARLLAFCLVIAGAALVPAPLRVRSDPA
jgi:drug/metabolite transporter (DMT)-like permease